MRCQKPLIKAVMALEFLSNRVCACFYVFSYLVVSLVMLRILYVMSGQFSCRE